MPESLPVVQMHRMPGEISFSKSAIPPYVFTRRYASEKLKHPFRESYIGKNNPYTEIAVNSEYEYYEYLREHTYLQLCDELVVKQVEELQESVKADITWLRNQNQSLKNSLASEERKHKKTRSVLIVLLALALIASIIFGVRAVSLSASTEDDSDVARSHISDLSEQQAAEARKYDEGYSAGEKEGYDAGHLEGYEEGDSDGYSRGYWEGYAAAERYFSGSGSRTGTGSSRDTPISNTYIGNRNSHKFHLPTCSYLPDKNNQVTFNSRDEALNAGYTPCGHCNP